MKSCIVIGGGVVGLFTAYYLVKAGHKVKVIDAGDFSDGCSYGNAGMIVPSHVIPLAQPGMLAQGFKWMLKSQSPFYVKPRLSGDLFNWAYKFYKSANQNHVDNSKKALCGLSLFSKELYQELAETTSALDYQEKGLLMLYQSEKVGEEEIHAAKIAQELGLEVDFLNPLQVANLETGLKTNVLGGVHFKSDAHLSPNQLMRFLKSELIERGANLQTKTQVLDFKISGNKINSVITNKGEFSGDEIIISAGAWSAGIAKKINIKISLLPGKGYSFNQELPEKKPTIPAILCEGKVAVSPINNCIRFGGTMEITHSNDRKINLNRVQGIVNTINNFYPDLNISLPEEKNIWHGYRPCSPTGLPIISRANKYSNLIIATGHSMMGLSLAPATGKLVQEIIDEKKLSVEIERFVF